MANRVNKKSRKREKQMVKVKQTLKVSFNFNYLQLITTARNISHVLFLDVYRNASKRRRRPSLTFRRFTSFVIPRVNTKFWKCIFSVWNATKSACPLVFRSHGSIFNWHAKRICWMRMPATVSLFSKLFTPGFAEQLFKHTESMNERFEVKVMSLDVISRLIGLHQLFVFNYYPFLNRFLQPHQRGKSLVPIRWDCL